MNPCPHEPLLTPYLLGDLPPHEADAIRNHVESCAACRATAAALAPTLTTLRAALAADALAPAALDPDRLARVLATPPDAPRHRSPQRFRWAAPLIGLAAALVLALGVFLPGVSMYRTRAFLTDSDRKAPSKTAAAPVCLSLQMEGVDTDADGLSIPGGATEDFGLRAGTSVAPGWFNGGNKAAGGRPSADQSKAADLGDAIAPTDPASPPADAADGSGGVHYRYLPAPPARAAKEQAAAEVVNLSGVVNGLVAGPTATAAPAAAAPEPPPPPSKPMTRAETAPATPALPQAPKPRATREGGKDVRDGRRAQGLERLDPAAELDRDTLRSLETLSDAGGAVGQSATKADEERSNPFSPQPASFDAVAIVKSPITMKGVYASRSPASRGAIMSGGGATPDVAGKLGREDAGERTTDSEVRAELSEDATPRPLQAGDAPAEMTKSLSGVVQNQERDRGRKQTALEEEKSELKREGESLAKAKEGRDLPPDESPELYFDDKKDAKPETSQRPDPVVPARPRPPLAFNPVIETATQPLSTFAIDVDTAAYTLARQSLLAGQLPDPERVRTEEIVNAFDYGDRAPDRATFRIFVEGAPTPFAPGRQLMRLGIKGRRIGREEQRPAVLTFLVDASGSMAQPDRIGLARQALDELLGQLGPGDRLQLLAFNESVRVLLDPTPAAERNAILAAFDRLQPTGPTNLERGMRLAYEQAAKSFLPGAENRVVLLSDGVANLGTAEADDILTQIDAARRQGITLAVFGVGRGTYNDNLLEQLANRGDGVYRFLDSPAEVRRAFVDDLGATLFTIASDVKIQVEWNPATVARYRQLGYENRALTAEQFRDDRVDAGEVGSGQAVTALYEIELATPPQFALRTAFDAPLGTVRVRYRPVGGGPVEEINRPILPEDLTPSMQDSRPAFRVAAGAAAFAERLRQSPHAAAVRFADIANLLRPAALELSLDTRIAELVRLVEAADGLTR